MMGRLDRSASRSCTVRLEELVPTDHLLRRVDQLLDLTSNIAELRPYYAQGHSVLITGFREQAAGRS